MPNINHNVLSGSELHEPKGVASADEGKVYIADGAGSGTWTYLPQGFGRYKDAGSAQVFNTTPAILTNDGAAGTTETSYLPRVIRGSDQLWDTSNSLITPVAVGDAYAIRIDLPITAKSGSPSLLNVTLDIGGGATITNGIVLFDISLAKTPPFTVSRTVNFDVGSTFFTNGGQLFMSTDAGTATVTNPQLQITRIHGEV